MSNMLSIINNEKGFKVIRMPIYTMRKIFHGTLCICDSCLADLSYGFYIPVIHQILCPDCFDKFIKRAKWHKEDSIIENKRYDDVISKIKSEVSTEITTDNYAI